MRDYIEEEDEDLLPTVPKDPLLEEDLPVTEAAPIEGNDVLKEYFRRGKTDASDQKSKIRLASAFDQIGQSLAGQKADPTFYNDLIKDVRSDEDSTKKMVASYLTNKYKMGQQAAMQKERLAAKGDSERRHADLMREMQSGRNANQLARDRDKAEVKAQTAAEKKNAVLTEVQQRQADIFDNINAVMKQIKEDGTYDLFGSHNADLDRRIDAIATDMAKLADPSSVARPSEVELVKKNLVESGIWQQDSTAMSKMKGFADEVNKRVANAYRVRGLTPPESLTAEAKVGPEAPPPEPAKPAEIDEKDWNQLSPDGKKRASDHYAKQAQKTKKTAKAPTGKPQLASPF